MLIVFGFLAQAGEEVKAAARELTETLCRTYERAFNLDRTADELDNALERYASISEITESFGFGPAPTNALLRSAINGLKKLAEDNKLGVVRGRWVVIKARVSDLSFLFQRSKVRLGLSGNKLVGELRAISQSLTERLVHYTVCSLLFRILHVC